MQLLRIILFLMHAFALSVTAQESFRPPAVPLVACDPYFSIWSEADKLTDKATTHWTGKSHRLTALLKIDGETYRLMGAKPESLPAMRQTSVEVLPTRTIYTFLGESVKATLTFTTPALPSDLMVLSRPTTYVTCEVSSTSNTPHNVAFYFDASGELTSNTPDQKVTGSEAVFANGTALKVGTTSQHILGQAGDDLRIDWGYLYLTALQANDPTLAFGTPSTLRKNFTEDTKATSIALPAKAGDVAASVSMNLGNVGAEAVSRYVLLAYDDLYSIEYMKEKLRPYWRKDGWQAPDLMAAAIDEYDALMTQCEEFDKTLMADLKKQGGEQYAQIAALAYRQCFAAGKFVADANGQPLQFCKENHSNGCIATSDVFYPMAPQFLLFGATLTKSVLVPFMEYAASERWRFPFAPHDLGTYPKANGQVYGGGERSEENQMPVEESGNMLILFGALAKMEGNADFAGRYWKQLTQWAKYLEEAGYDPENQLCTDDFAGHMAHNVNLSAKAICGIGSYAILCQMRGDTAGAERYAAIAKDYAKQWVAAARDGDHYRLAFDQPGTWSQKYNLVWDRILDLGLFPQEVYQTEMAFYRKTQNAYGLPLDNRSDYTKLDWILWTATLTEKQDDFAALVSPVHKFLHETPDRSPMTDWYFTSTAKKRGFTARPVVGGVFLRMLYDQEVWSRYASKDKTNASGWAPMPIPPERHPLVSTSEPPQILWHYTTEKPEGVWFAEDYEPDDWKQGIGGFGTAGTPGAVIGTEWKTDDIWLRREFDLPKTLPARIGLRIHHDENAVVYLNGKWVAELDGFTSDYDLVEIPVSSVRSGTNTMAIHCHQTSGGQYIDCGLDAIVPKPLHSGNPLFPGWYADPEAIIIGDEYWIFPTYSAPYDEQLHLDAFSSPDLVNWTKHEKIIDQKAISWLRRALWAPAIVAKDGKYYLFFGGNDIQKSEELGGIGVAVADKPSGPYKDLLGKPLIDDFHHGAQPIDQFVFHDKDGQYYMIYGGWSHCNIAKLRDDFTGFIPFEDGSTFREITPEGYVEGPFMFIREGRYYFMWSEGGWGGPNYSVAYAIADSPLGPFKRIGKVLQQDPKVATGAGHHSVIHDSNADLWYAVYHRRPLTETDRNHRVTCIDRMTFDDQGFINPIRITSKGVAAKRIQN